jgi:hypothetical protein
VGLELSTKPAYVRNKGNNTIYINERRKGRRKIGR